MKTDDKTAMIHLMEECSELQKALSKFLRTESPTPAKRYDILEEMADVSIMTSYILHKVLSVGVATGEYTDIYAAKLAKHQDIYGR